MKEKFIERYLPIGIGLFGIELFIQWFITQMISSPFLKMHDQNADIISITIFQFHYMDWSTIELEVIIPLINLIAIFILFYSGFKPFRWIWFGIGLGLQAWYFRYHLLFHKFELDSISWPIFVLAALALSTLALITVLSRSETLGKVQRNLMWIASLFIVFLFLFPPSLVFLGDGPSPVGSAETNYLFFLSRHPAGFMGYYWYGMVMTFHLIFITLAITLLVFEPKPASKRRRWAFAIISFPYFYLTIITLNVGISWIIAYPLSWMVFLFILILGFNKEKNSYSTLNGH